MAGHISRMVNRGWAGLWPSKLACPSGAALYQMMDAQLLKRIQDEAVTRTGAIQESLMRDPKDEATLLLFETGHFWERVIGDALIEEYGHGLGKKSGRNVRIEDEDSLLSGEIDILTPGPNGTLTAWEVKSTKQWSMDNYGPNEAHVVQLGVYVYIWNRLNKDCKIEDAYLVYVPNDKHAQSGRVLSKMKTIHLDDALATLDGELPHKRLKKAQEYIQTFSLENPPPPYLDARDWPCSRKKNDKQHPNCPFFHLCHKATALEEPGPWGDEIPF